MNTKKSKKISKSHKEDIRIISIYDRIIYLQERLRHYDAICLLLNKLDDFELIQMIELKQKGMINEILKLIYESPKARDFVEDDYLNHLLKVLG